MNEAELADVLSDLIGQPQGVAGLQAAADRVTEHYRARGFVVARAYLPPQDVTDGTVVIEVVEGRVGAIRLRNRSLVHDARAMRHLESLRDGNQAVHGAPLERSLLILRETPGVGAARATLQPGADVGTTDVLVELDRADRLSAWAGLDNHGSRYTGARRAWAGFSVASPAGLGDALQASALASDGGLRYLGAGWQLPLGDDGVRVGASLYAMDYRLGREFSVLGADGQARGASLVAIYPVLRRADARWTASATLERKRLDDRVALTAWANPRVLDALSWRLEGRWLDGLAGQNSAELGWTVGRLRLDSAQAQVVDRLSARTEGGWQRWAWSLARLQSLGTGWQGWIQVSGQSAADNLDSAEKFSLGGPNGVRAYPQGEAVGDRGWLASMELRATAHRHWQVALFHDLGAVTAQARPFAQPVASARRLAGTGLSLTGTVGPVQARAVVAWRTRGGMPQSVPAGGASSPMAWLQMSAAW